MPHLHGKEQTRKFENAIAQVRASRSRRWVAGELDWLRSQSVSRKVMKEVNRYLQKTLRGLSRRDHHLSGDDLEYLAWRVRQGHAFLPKGLAQYTAGDVIHLYTNALAVVLPENGAGCTD